MPGKSAEATERNVSQVLSTQTAMLKKHDHENDKAQALHSVAEHRAPLLQDPDVCGRLAIQQHMRMPETPEAQVCRAAAVWPCMLA